MTVAELASPVASLPRQGHPRPARTVASAPAGDLARFFRDNYPILLDGAGSALPRRRFLDAAGLLTDNASGPLPQAVLREALELLHSTPRPETPVGATVIGPKAARVWWDYSLLAGRTDELSAGFDRPRPVLRFFDVTGRANSDDSPEAGPHHEMFDIDVDLSAGGKTVQFWRSARTYGVALGLLRTDSAFAPIARLGALRLPSDGPAPAAPAGLVRSNLRPARQEGAGIVPDAAALAWAAARPDFPDRDIQAELALHMLYRAFLEQGPGALRRRVSLARRDDDVLAAEYAARRAAVTAVAFPAKPEPAFLVAVLAPGKTAAATSAAAAPRFSPAVCTPAASLSSTDFAWLGQILAFARSGIAAGPALPAPPVTAGLVRPLAASLAEPLALRHAAEPVFQAADNLRARLAGLREASASEGVVRGDVTREGVIREDAVGADVTREKTAHEKSPAPQPDPVPSVPAANRPLVAGAEPARLARAGVRVTRLSLAIEGRMRPGARLRVAGKLVSADADGNFRLECLLTGRRAAVPLRSGDAVSSINVNWEKRPLRAKSPF